MSRWRATRMISSFYKEKYQADDGEREMFHFVNGGAAHI
jgi:hypothetical protein